jgi:hypothetical protein
MALSPAAGRERLERLPPFAWGVVGILFLSIVYAVLQITMVRPYLWPAGAGFQLDGDPAARLPFMARPPEIARHFGRPLPVTEVAPLSPAAEAGIVPGDAIVAMRRWTDGGPAVTFPETADTAARLAAWKRLYWVGTTERVEVVLDGRAGSRTETLERPSVGTSAAEGWARRHAGMIVQLVVFTGGAALLFLLRSHDLTACLAVLALALSGVAGGGPLLGEETMIPLGPTLTVFSWLAGPLAFPIIALAILYFPARSPLLKRHSWLHAVPLVVASPMIVPGAATSLYLTGVDWAQPLAVWDAMHPGVYHASFVAALAVNVLAIVEGLYRYRFNHDANERRRIRMAVYTAVPGVAAYAVRDGLQVLSSLVGSPPPRFPTAIVVVLNALVLLPAFGLVYAVGVERVLGPRVVLRRSLQYALANRSLSLLAILPAIALVISLVRDRDRTIGQIVAGGSGVYVLLILASAAAFKYRDYARQWLDQRFFREEYDARKILLSLVSRVRFETDPADLASMVVNQLDAALHPETIAILVSGIEDGKLTPVTVLHGSAESLPLDGGLVAMLRWSDDPLEIFPHDPRSPARRLPPEEREWLECTGASLLVPVLGEDRSLIAVIVLGERRSEQAYTAEDRQLLASIATQMGLGFDVARLRQRLGSRAADTDPEATRLLSATVRMMTECPRCGRCEEADVTVCPSDGSTMRPVSAVPRTVDNKYRIEQLLGRGGMGAVYRARDMRLDRLVALKVVRAELLGDPEARRRFRREAQIVARLQHPSIVAVFDYGTFVDGGAYLVMELVRGEDLRRVLQREGRLEPHRAVRILNAVCSAIEAAHREGVLHRDLKPENILLPGSGVDAKVLDFGVAKVIAEERGDAAASPEAPTVLTAAGMIVGTPAYMAPEQFKGVQPDGRTDVFSLGVIAYEMLSGELPFGRGSLADVVLAQARGVPPMQGTANPAVERAIRATLDRDPDRRPASPQAFAHLLSSAVGV